MDTAINITEEINLRQRDQFMEHMIQSTSGYFDILTIYLGERLGLYRALDKQKTLTSEELAARTGTYERYIREWLEQQTVAGIIEVIDPAVPPQKRRYHLPTGHAEVLLDRDSVNHLAPMVRLLVGAVPCHLLLRPSVPAGECPGRPMARMLGKAWPN